MPRRKAFDLSISLVALALFASSIAAGFLSSPIGVRAPEISIFNTNRLFAMSSDRVNFYSPNFHRHIVAEYDGTNYTNILESFLFLDEAEEKYPNASRCLTDFWDELECMAGIGLHDEKSYVNCCKRENGIVPATVFSSASEPRAAAMNQVVDKLSTMLGTSFWNFVPKKEHALVRERIQFMLAPLPSDIENFDIPKGFFGGFGAGLSINQTVSVLVVLRDYLAPNPSQALKLKASAAYIVTRVGVPVELLGEVRDTLGGLLDDESFADVAAFAYLRSLEVSWDQCRVIIRAFSMSNTACALERIGVFDKGLRDPLQLSTIRYLQTRLQMSPVETINMIRAHPRLSGYSAEVIKRHSDTIQSSLGLTSRDLKELLQKQPSIVGRSEKKINLTVSFFQDELLLDRDQMRELVNKHPSMLSYNLEQNIRTKVNFLYNDVGLKGYDLSVVIRKRPQILAQSFEMSLKPSVEGLRKALHLTAAEMARIATKNPSILTSKWLTTLKPKLEFLVEAMQLDNTASLRPIIQISPSILSQSITTSLQPKIDILLEAAHHDEDLLSMVLRSNPSLLVGTKSALMKRVAMLSLRNITFAEGFYGSLGSRATVGEKQKSVLTRRKKSVLEICDDQTVQVFADVQTAASSLGITNANMYNIISSRRIFKGKSYLYGTLPKVPERDFDDSRERSRLGLNSWERSVVLADNSAPQGVDLISVLCKPKKYNAFGRIDASLPGNETDLYLAIYVTSGTHKPEGQGSATPVGAMGVYFPQLQGTGANSLLQMAIENTIVGITLPTEAGTDLTKGLVISFFPDQKATKNRCTLFACSNALRLAIELLAADPRLIGYDLHIDLITDSTFVWELLRDQNSVMEWGSFTSGNAFVHEGQKKPWNIHPDILFPVARTYFRLKEQRFETPKFGRRTHKLVNDVSISVLHHSDKDLSWTRTDPIVKKLKVMTTRAAKFHYDRITRFKL